MIDIQLPDGSKRNMPDVCTIADVAASIGPGLARAAVAGKRNGAVVDLTQVLNADDKVEIIEINSESAIIFSR